MPAFTTNGEERLTVVTRQLDHSINLTFNVEEGVDLKVGTMVKVQAGGEDKFVEPVTAATDEPIGFVTVAAPSFYDPVPRVTVQTIFGAIMYVEAQAPLTYGTKVYQSGTEGINNPQMPVYSEATTGIAGGIVLEGAAAANGVAVIGVYRQGVPV